MLCREREANGTRFIADINCPVMKCRCTLRRQAFVTLKVATFF
jgi:hypothetical protein